MKLLIVFFVIFITSSIAREKCYTIQLLSTSVTTANKYKLLNQNLGDECKIKELDGRLKLRCQCKQTVKELTSSFKNLKYKYKDAYITKVDKKVFLDITTSLKKLPDIKSCYSVELFKTKLDDTVSYKLQKTLPECRNLQIGKSLSLRCGCYATKQEVKESLQKYKKHYKDALLVKTYRSRFASLKQKKKKNLTPVTPLIKDTIYQQALEAYNAKNYKKAATLFQRCTSYYGDINMQLLWAKSELLQPKRLEYAIAAYVRVTTLEPSNIDAFVTLAQLYKKNTEYSELQKTLSFLQDKRLTKTQWILLSQLEKKKEIKLDKLSGVVGLKVGYDTNVASVSENNDLNISSIEQEVVYIQGLFSIEYFHDLQTKGGWFSKLNSVGVFQKNSYSTMYDTKFLKLSGALGYKEAAKTYMLPISYSFTSYLNKNLLSSYGFMPSLVVHIGSEYRLHFTTGIDIKRYIPDEMKKYNAFKYKGAFALQYFFAKNVIKSSLEYQHTKQQYSSSSSVPLYIDNDEFIASLGLNYSLEKGYSINANYKIAMKLFNENIYMLDSSNNYVFQNEKRKDFLHSITFGLSKKLFKNIMTKANYSYTKNITNYKASEYKKHNIYASVNYSF